MSEISGASQRNIRPRASKPKARTGCVSCKIRRVKCDEAKPYCNRCIKACIKCDGYAVPKKRPVTRPAPPFIAPDFTPILWEPSDRLTQNERDFRYLKVFCEKTSHQLNGIRATNLWSGLMLQASERNSAVRHGIIAIAALDITLQLKHDRLLNHRYGAGTIPVDPRTHYQFALRQYGLAIQAMQKETSKGTQDLASMLVTCLVIICFETFQGNSYNALAQINTGLLLIEQAVAQKGDSPSSLVDGVESALVSRVDESLIRAFVRLDLQAMSFIGNLTRGIPNPAFRMGSALTSLRDMPIRFNSLSEARNYLDLFMVWGMLACNPDIAQRPGRGNLFPDSSRPFFSATSIADRQDCLDIAEKWHRAFQFQLALASTKTGSNDILDAMVLELYYLAALCALQMASTGIQKQVPCFQKMLALSKQIVNHPSVKKGKTMFAFDLDIVFPLYILAWKCPHSETRRGAIELLIGTQRQEGLWDGVMAGKITRWIADLEEEEGLTSDGCTFPERRITALTVDYDTSTRTALVSGLMPKKGEEGKERVKAKLS